MGLGKLLCSKLSVAKCSPQEEVVYNAVVLIFCTLSLDTMSGCSFFLQCVFESCWKQGDFSSQKKTFLEGLSSRNCFCLRSRQKEFAFFPLFGLVTLYSSGWKHLRDRLCLASAWPVPWLTFPVFLPGCEFCDCVYACVKKCRFWHLVGFFGNTSFPTCHCSTVKKMFLNRKTWTKHSFAFSHGYKIAEALFV